MKELTVHKSIGIMPRGGDIRTKGLNQHQPLRKSGVDELFPAGASDPPNRAQDLTPLVDPVSRIDYGGRFGRGAQPLCRLRRSISNISDRNIPR